jgi:hypothetical protein
LVGWTTAASTWNLRKPFDRAADWMPTGRYAARLDATFCRAGGFDKTRIMKCLCTQTLGKHRNRDGILARAINPGLSIDDVISGREEARTPGCSAHMLPQSDEPAGGERGGRVK